MKLNDVLSFFEVPSITRTRAIAGAFEDAAKAIQAQAEHANDTTAAVFISQRSPRNLEAERAYRAKVDEIQAAAVAILRAKGR